MQREDRLPGVSATAAVGVDQAEEQVILVVVMPSGHQPGRIPRRRASLRLADTDLADGVREAAGLDVAAVLVAARLPVDIRHQSKVDRSEVARRAARVLAGARPPSGRP